MGEPDFEPERKIITAITNAKPAVVTATAHRYTTGYLIKITVPISYGMRIDDLYRKITVVDANNFSIDFDSSLLDAFVVPGSPPYTPAQAIPVTGETDNIAT